MFISIILGTAREGARSAKVADFVLEKAKEFGFSTELVKAGDYVEARTARVAEEGNRKALPWKEIVEKSDGLILIIPEYNHSFPGELKILLDSLFDEYSGLVAGLVGVSSGRLGGARAVEHIKPILTNFQMMVTQKAVYFPDVKNLFDESGNITDESYTDRLQGLFGEIKNSVSKLKD